MVRPPHLRRSRATRNPVEWEFKQLSFGREFSKSFVTRFLVDRAEHGGWELDRVRIGNDGVRRVLLRRKIIRARPTLEQTA